MASGEWWVFMCLKTADVASEDVWGIMLTWRGRSLVHVHTARALFFIILIILKAKLIFLIYFPNPAIISKLERALDTQF